MGFHVGLRQGRLILGGIALAGALLTGPLAPQKAGAAISICRRDPIVRLSDGTAVTLTAVIRDDPADISKITYTLHAPAGVSVSGVVYTGGPLNQVESLNVVADNAPNTYDSDTLVSTGNSGIAVTATTTVANVGSASTSGYDDQTLHVQVSS